MMFQIVDAFEITQLKNIKKFTLKNKKIFVVQPKKSIRVIIFVMIFCFESQNLIFQEKSKFL